MNWSIHPECYLIIELYESNEYKGFALKYSWINPKAGIMNQIPFFLFKNFKSWTNSTNFSLTC